MSTVNLILNHYIGDDINPSRQVSFLITEECLKDYLSETEDERSIDEFLETYDSDESEVVYGYATDDGRIISECVSYCDAFVEAYNGFIERTVMFNPEMKAKEIATKENYYWTVYAQ